jgi:hypothetical protein
MRMLAVRNWFPSVDLLPSYYPDTMFGGYTEVAAYYVDTDPIAPPGFQVPLPNEYISPFAQPDPWHRKAACQEDFILIAEFSEREGPKPLVSSMPVRINVQLNLSFHRLQFHPIAAKMPRRVLILTTLLFDFFPLISKHRLGEIHEHNLDVFL